MSNGRYCYHVTVHISENTKTTNVLSTHRLAMAWAKDQRDVYCSKKFRYSAINGSGLTDLGSIGIEIQRERIRGE